MADNSTSTDHGAYNQHVWSGGLNVASVDLIAMVVSDAGLASTEPQWWNASPLGCVLIGCQPRGGWQVLQRAVQWGTDHWARCFGVDCKLSFLYAYFACSIRNRLEVWKSDNFISPMQTAELEPQYRLDTTTPAAPAPLIETSSSVKEGDGELKTFEPRVTVVEKSTTDETLLSSLQPRTDDELQLSQHGSEQKTSEPVKAESSAKSSSSDWKPIDRGVRGVFHVQRPTKLLDGSRGGQAFMCDVLCPAHGNAYGVEEQSRLQLLSVLLVVAGLTHTDDYDEFVTILGDDFGFKESLGSTFFRLLPCLLAANFTVVAFGVSIFYALWHHNIYGRAAPYMIQLCSLASWSSGAMGLLMLGGNPRVKIDKSKPAAKHIQQRLDTLSDDEASVTTISFGSLHGSVYVQDRGSCAVSTPLLRSISRIKLVPTRHYTWYLGMAWFSCFLLIGVVLQIAGSRVATLKSECMSITLLVLTAVLRGAGLAGPEEWMIPRWKRRSGAQYAVQLQGRIHSRTSVPEG